MAGYKRVPIVCNYLHLLVAIIYFTNIFSKCRNMYSKLNNNCDLIPCCLYNYAPDTAHYNMECVSGMAYWQYRETRNAATFCPF